MWARPRLFSKNKIYTEKQQHGKKEQLHSGAVWFEIVVLGRSVADQLAYLEKVFCPTGFYVLSSRHT